MTMIIGFIALLLLLPRADAATSVSMCFHPEVLVPSNPAGYSCIGVSSPHDSNNGDTNASCDNVGGEWTAYDCQDAYDALQTGIDQDTIDYLITNWWGSKCCSTPTSSPISPTSSPIIPTSPPSVSMCVAPKVLVPSNPAGDNCVGSPTNIDSNAGGTSAECDSADGEWTAYDCQDAYGTLQTITDPNTINYLINNWWGSKCCSTPTSSPISPTSSPISPTSSPISNNGLAVCGGKPNGKNRCQPLTQEAPLTARYGVRCCADSDLPRFKQKSQFPDCFGTVWARSHLGPGVGCQMSATHAEAVTFCENVGARLCTKDELLAKCAKATGCQLNKKLVWSSSSP